MHKLQQIGIAIFTVLSLAFSQSSSAAPYNGHVVVAKAGGNYSTISAAMAAINPTATNPYVIEVWPGTYTEQISIKSYVHLKGSGANVTTINGAGTDAVIINGRTNVRVTGFTLTGGYVGIEIFSPASNVIIENNVISNNAPAGIAS